MFRNLASRHSSQFKYLVHAARHHATKSAVTTNSHLEQFHIDEAIKLAPTLSVHTTDTWRRAHETFQNHGLETINFLRIVTGNPTVLKRTPESIIESLEIWRACQFGERLLYQLLTKYPELLDVKDPQKLLLHIAFLKNFCNTNKNVWKILMNSPDLLQQSEDTVEKKFTYIVDTMRIEVPEIVKSAALSLTFKELRCRHVFMVRLGLFKPRKPKEDPNAPTTNSRLYKITDTSEKSFATKVCHVTLDEYEAFKELFAREIERRSQYSNNEDELSEDDE